MGDYHSRIPTYIAPGVPDTGRWPDSLSTDLDRGFWDAPGAGSGEARVTEHWREY